MVTEECHLLFYRLARSGADPSDITVFNPRHMMFLKGKIVSDVPDSSFDNFIGFKPQHLIDVTPGIQKLQVQRVYFPCWLACV